jgi:putative transposase
MVDYKYNRYSIRLTGYDYSQPGYYFFTIVTQDRGIKFGVIRDRKIQLNDVGNMVDLEWKQIPERFTHAILDKYIIMPDHFHGIIQLLPNRKIPVHHKTQPACNKNNVGTPLVGIHPPKLSVPGAPDHFNGSKNVKNGISGEKTLFEIIGAFKSITTNRYVNGVKNNNWQRFDKRLWQLRYHDHIIRNENDLNRIREYIIANPMNYHPPTR